MATISINRSSGGQVGVRSNITDFTLNLERPVWDPTNSAGSTGSITYSTDREPDVMMLRGAGIILSDGSGSQVRGSVVSVSQDVTLATVTADTVLAAFNADLTIPPRTGTLSANLSAFFAQVRAAAPGMAVAPTLGTVAGGTTSTIFPGGRMNAWVYLKYLCQKFKLYPQIATDGSTVNFVSMSDTVSLGDTRTITRSFDLDDSQVGQSVQVNYYNMVSVTNGEVYPIRGNVANAQIIQANAGETVVLDIKVDAWLTSVNQPAVQNYVGPGNTSGTTGAYSVAGNDGLPITAAQWTATGGRLTVAIDALDPSLLHVTVTAPSDTKYAPYSIAATSGNLYSSLHITGTGVTFQQTNVVVPTGCTIARTGDAIATVVDNPFVSTQSEAYDVALRAAQSYAGPTYTLHKDVDAGLTGVRDYLNSKFVTPDAEFAVTDSSYTGTTVTLNAAANTPISSFNTKWSGATIAQFNTSWTGATCSNFAVAPIRRK